MPPCVLAPGWCVSDREVMPPCLRDSNLPPTRRGRDASVRARLPQFESRITNHESRPFGRSGRSGPPLCGGTPPATPPCSYATVRARPQLVCRRPGSDATVRARPQLVCQRPGGNATVPAGYQPIARSTGALRPLKFLTADHWPLATDHRPTPAWIPLLTIPTPRAGCAPGQLHLNWVKEST